MKWSMRRLAALIAVRVLVAAGVISFLLVCGLCGTAAASTLPVPSGAKLQDIIDAAQSGDTLIIAAGVYRAEPVSMIDSLCGNCEEHRTLVNATAGFTVRGKSLVIIGRDRRSVVLETRAGYGVFFDGSAGSILQNLTITGGRRDPDGRATDAAIVVRRSMVTIKDCTIADNTSRIDTVIVGIGGVFGREGAELFIIGNEIHNNGWDGIALYRGATAYIADNVISQGRGAGIGITWDARATVLRNRVSGYWKGIGTFGDSRAVASGNAVFDNLGWGIIATGTSWLDASNNVVWHNGNCGLALWSETCTARFTNNIVARNGWRKEWVCPCVGVWASGPNPRVEFSYNDVWGNEVGGYDGIDDLTGREGNVSVDPGFSGKSEFKLPPGSPLIGAGNPLITGRDGSRSDIGLGRRQ